MSIATRPAAEHAARVGARRGAQGAAIVGLAARGVLYLLLAWLGIQLVVGSSKQQVDSRGALHQLAHEGVGTFVLVLLVIGFAGFAVWHLGAVGAAVIAGGLFLIGRVLTGGPTDEPAVLDAAPLETDGVRALAMIGNIARGAVVVLIGVFLIIAAAQYDPSKTVGLDGALKRLLDAAYGGVFVGLASVGLAAFGLASVARAWINRGAPRER